MGSKKRNIDHMEGKYPVNPTLALRYLFFGFLATPTWARRLSLFYPYKGKSIPWIELLQRTAFLIFFLIDLQIYFAVMGYALHQWVQGKSILKVQVPHILHHTTGCLGAET